LRSVENIVKTPSTCQILILGASQAKCIERMNGAFICTVCHLPERLKTIRGQAFFDPRPMHVAFKDQHDRSLFSQKSVAKISRSLDRVAKKQTEREG